MAHRLTAKDINYIRSLLGYDPISGDMRWLVSRKRYGGTSTLGMIAGSIRSEEEGGYIQIGIDGYVYRAHRLAWVMMTGKDVPKGFDVDHRNRCPAENWWDNLRLATRGQNVMNSHKVRPDNKSGVRGVSWCSRDSNWVARISVNKKIMDLGKFATLEEAAAARHKAETAYYGEFGCWEIRKKGK